MVLTHLFFLLITEFSYLMYRKNAVYNGKQEQMKWANDVSVVFETECESNCQNELFFK